jgi:outer membrane protein assembly factor BamB
MTRARVLVSLLALAGCDDATNPAGRIATVTITAPELAGLAGWTLPLTATAADSAGALVSEARFTWASGRVERAAVDSTGLVTFGPEYGAVLVIASERFSGLADTVVLRRARVGEIRWAVATSYPLQTSGGPTLESDGSVWVLTAALTVEGNDRSELVRFSPRGQVLCAALLPGVYENPVVVPPAGDWVWVTGAIIYRIGPGCEVLQSFDTEWFGAVFLSGAVAADGMLYAAAGPYLHALSPTLDERWRSPFSPRSGWLQPPAVTNERVYAKVSSDSLYAFDRRTGAVLWTVAEPDSGADLSTFVHGPAVANGRLYLPGRFRFTTFDTTGVELWQSPPGGTGVSEPAIAPDGRVYMQIQQAVVGRDLPGTEVWRDPRGRPRWAGWIGGPALAADGTLYVAALDAFYAFDVLRTPPLADPRWQVRTVPGDSAWFAGSPAIAPDGTVYTWGGTHVYALFGAAPPHPDSPWPMWRHDAQRTGRVP